MWAVVRRTVIATLLGCWALPVAADSPAQLVVGEWSIEELLSVPPSLKRGRYAVHCEVYIQRSGRVPQAFCFAIEQPAPDDLVDAVSKAALRARFVPAMRGGESIDVYAVLMVLIDTTLGEPMILAVPNSGVEKQKFGLLYTAPQRIVPKPSWGIPGARYFGRRPDRFVLMQFQIGERGDVLGFSFLNLTHENAPTLRRIEEQARDYKFLPGHHEGRAVPMMYVEPSFSVY